MIRFLSQLRARWRLLRLFEAMLYALALGIAVAALCVLFLPPGERSMAVWLGLGASLLGLGVLATAMTAASPRTVQLAIATDRRLALAEKLASALEVAGTPAGPVAEALLLDAESTAQSIRPALVEPWFAPRMKWALLALALALLLAAGAFWTSHAPAAEGAFAPVSATPEPLVSASDIAEAAELIAADAETREDAELAAVAQSMRTLAQQLDEAPPDAEAMGELAALLERAGNRYGNPLHNWPPFEGDQTGLADRMDAAQKSPPARGGSGQGSGQGAGTSGEKAGGESPQPVDPSVEVKPSSLPGTGDEGEGVGIEPPGGQNDNSAMGANEEGFVSDAPQPPGEGNAEGAGEGESDMAGTGEMPDKPGSQTSSVQGGFAETQTLAAKVTSDAERVRTSATTEADTRAVDDAVLSRQWPRQDAMPVERQLVPSAAAAAMARFFNRDEQIAP